MRKLTQDAHGHTERMFHRSQSGTLRVVAQVIQSNVVYPFNMIYARPYMTYHMSTGVCMKKGTSTG